jgi:ABC-type Fe3+-hydroxamate transport system substrate-binding protein
MNHAYFSRSEPRLVDGFEILARILHPERFPDDVPPDTARRVV